MKQQHGFASHDAGDPRTDLTTPREFIQKQLERYGSRLRAKEEELGQFRREHSEVLLEDGDFYSHLEQQRERVEELEAVSEEVPDIQSEYTRLRRDYETLQSSYAELRDRLEQAELAGEIEAGADTGAPAAQAHGDAGLLQRLGGLADRLRGGRQGLLHLVG